MRVRDCLKYLKRGWNRKDGRGNKDFIKREQAGSRGGCLKDQCSPSYRNQSTDLQWKSIDWFLYDKKHWSLKG